MGAARVVVGAEEGCIACATLGSVIGAITGAVGADDEAFMGAITCVVFGAVGGCAVRAVGAEEGCAVCASQSCGFPDCQFFFETLAAPSFRSPPMPNRIEDGMVLRSQPKPRFELYNHF